MPNRDEYLFDLIAEAGLDVTDPGDWPNISNFVFDLIQTGEIDG